MPLPSIYVLATSQHERQFVSFYAGSLLIRLEAGGEGICRHLICLGLVGKTMGASGVMRDFLFLSEAPGVMLCDFPLFFFFSLWKPLEAKPTYSFMCEHASFSNPLPFIGREN